MTAQISATLARDGFAIVEAVLDEVDLSAFVEQLERSLRSSTVGIRRREDVFAARDLVELLPSTRSLLDLPRLRPLLREVLGEQPRLVRALLFDKPPSSNWAVPWHQDRTIAVEQRAEIDGFTAWTRKAGVLHVQPPATILERMLTVRIHLDDAADEGPLHVVHASHRHGLIAAGQIADFVAQGEVVRCRVPRGGALVMRPLLLHSSRATRGAAHRRVVHLELAAFELPAPLQWNMGERILDS